ncbi:ribosomal protein S18 [Dactylonectria estremocensis]|uniref:Small ribosomal subunit protein bS18m n=1 Tax=Dactylonectria estremocensis TaxID=1079267 RepID=A0A9P9J5S7_9HYPO|nr:ribosomal protein S18 [Dactylonectria estremocensis]
MFRVQLSENLPNLQRQHHEITPYAVLRLHHRAHPPPPLLVLRRRRRTSPPREGHHAHPGAGSQTGRLSNLNNSGSSRWSNSPSRGGDAAERMLERSKARASAYVREKSAQMEFLKTQKMSNDYLRQMPRRWQAGDVYSPHDLSPVEMSKWRKRSPPKIDVIDALGINPVDMYKNFSLIEFFTTPSAMIKHSKGTRLRPVNQRKIAKMVRRAQGMGLYPTIHDHPELLREHFFSTRQR